MNWKTLRDVLVVAASIILPLILNEVSDLVIGDEKATTKKPPEGG